MRLGLTFGTVFATGLLLPALCAGAVQSESMRWAIAVGNNDGGSARERLRWAEQDARRFVRLLTELGRFPHDQVHLLLGRGPEQVFETIERLSSDEIPPDAGGSLLVIYFSGHSDGRALLMGDDQLSIAALKRAVDRSPAEVSLIILDACNAGAALRTKGGRSAPSFLRFDDGHRSRGRIILASAAAHELAQESDDIASSVFTHYLLSGLRGEADRSGDRRVSLAEVYRYVYHQTVNETVDTVPGVQHPSFSYDLKGEGSIILTDLNSGSSGILLPADAFGTYLLFDRDRHSVVAEVHKKTGERRLVPVSPGRYAVKKRLADHLLVAEVTVGEDGLHEVRDEHMEPIEFADPATKGWDLHLTGRPQRIDVRALAAWTGFGRSPAGGVWGFASGGIALGYRGWPTRHWHPQLAVTAGTWASQLPAAGERIPFRLVQVGLSLSLGRALIYGPFHLEAGGRLAALWLQRRFDHKGYAATDSAFGVGPQGYVAFAVNLNRYRLMLELVGGALCFPGADRVLVPSHGGGLALGLGF